MNKVITQLIDGKPVLDNEGDIVYLVGLVVSINRMSSTKDGIAYTLSEAKEFEPYTSPEQIEIERLNEIIKVQNAQLNVKVEQANIEKQERKTYNRLSKGEVREIELMFESGKDIKRTDMMNTYNTSQPAISKIATAKHTHTSELYKTFIMKRDLGTDDVNS